MQIYLSETHTELAKEVRAFAEEVIAPVARESDEASEFPWESVKAMAERGFLGVPVPCEFGGMGRDYLSYILVVEEIAKIAEIAEITSRLPPPGSRHAGMAKLVVT